MGKVKLLSEGPNHQVYQLANGKVVRMEINEEWTEIKFMDHKDKKFGEFEFKEHEPGTFKLMRMYTEPLQKSGIGRAALEFFKDRTSCRIVVSPPDGQTRDDQSHLTGNAPAFVKKMLEAGLIDGYDSHTDDGINGFFES